MEELFTLEKDSYTAMVVLIHFDALNALKEVMNATTKTKESV